MVELKTLVFFSIHVHTRVLQVGLCIGHEGLFVYSVYWTWRFSFLRSQLALANEKFVIGESRITSSSDSQSVA